MQSYTLEEARKIIMNCAKQYHENLENKIFLIIFRDRSDNLIKYLEISFKRENYQHLTGVDMIDENGNRREHVAELFYVKCLNRTLKKNEIRLKRDGTTILKLAALPALMQIYKITKIIADYNKNGPYLVADKIVGNINFCLGIKQISDDNLYVPVSSLLENIKKMGVNQSQVLAVFSKECNESIYREVRHVSKGVNLNRVKFSAEILEKISLEKYEPK